MIKSRNNARYAKLRRQVGKVKLIIKKAIYIAARHFCTLARFEVVFNKIIGRKKVIEKLRRTFFLICSDTQNICIATPAMRSEPCFAKVRTNVRQKNITLLVCGDIARRRRRR